MAKKPAAAAGGNAETLEADVVLVAIGRYSAAFLYWPSVGRAAY